MKLKHWVFLGLTAVGVLFVWHIAASHGGLSGFKSGLGI
jgi:hypothetical protein